MPTNYPGAIDSAPTTHADASDAYLAIENELGTDPAGAFATVKARLDASAPVVAESHTDTTVVNTTVETDAVSLSLPAGSVAAGDVVRLSVWAEHLNNSGSTVAYTYRLKFGATTVLTTSSVNGTTNAATTKYVITCEAMIESTTAQRWRGDLLGERAGQSWSSGSVARNAGYGTSAEDTATAKDVKLTVQMSAASPSADFVVHAAALEISKKAA